MINNKKFPICPWCGEQMNVEEYHAFIEMNGDWGGRMSCNKCGATMPPVLGKATKAEALRALRELKPKSMQNRVLTLEEVLVIACDDYNTPEQETVLWLERRGEEGGYATIPNIFAEDGKNVFEFSGIGFDVALITEGYGKHWRCWRTKPTFEERSKMSWEDEKE